MEELNTNRKQRKEAFTMKVDNVYYFQDDTKKPIVLYKFDTNKEAINYCDECDKRKTRQTCFESAGKYYVGEYITEEVAHNLIANHEQHDITTGNWSDYILFFTEQQAYGDMRYYFNNKTKQFYREFYNIGD